MGMFVVVLSVLMILVTASFASDSIVTCEGEVVTGSAVFQKVKGQLTKLRVEGRVGDCPFSTSGKYRGAGDAILSVCPEPVFGTKPDICNVRALVGKVPGSVYSHPGTSGCCDLWIKEVISVANLTNGNQKAFERKAGQQSDSIRSATKSQVKFIRGEGNVLGVELALDAANNFGLTMFCSKNRPEGTKELGLSIYVNNEARVSLAVVKLKQGQQVHDSRNINVCINSRCRAQTWSHIDEGGSFGTESPVVIGNTHEPIRSIGIDVPDDPAHYEFQGNIDSVLTKICAEY